ncbi:MAG TPA: hypothetical protein VJ910_00835 [Desulfuromonadales bacterium]|nr:hypothetical protein [Desulfuromonadales bacterium]
MTVIARACLIILVCGFGLTACGLDKLVHPPAAQGREALDAFVLAMQLEEFSAAAVHLVPDNRQAFLEQFATLDKDLHIIEARIAEMVIGAEGRRAEVALEMDYYLLPSVTVKTFRFDHTWIYYEASGQMPARYQIVTPFSRFP